MQACEILLHISILDILDDLDGGFQPNPKFVHLLKFIGTAADPVAIFRQYTDRIAIGEGDVLIFKSAEDPVNRVIFDLYRDPEDQIDLIAVGIFCSSDIQDGVARLLMDFFLGCRRQINMSISAVNCQLRELADASRYPRARIESGYIQKLISI